MIETDNKQSFLNDMTKAPADAYASNLTARLELCETDGKSFPIIVNDGAYSGPAVCSPYGQFCLYPLHELRKQGSGVRKVVGIGLYRALAFALPMLSFNRVVTIDDLAGGTILGSQELCKAARRLTETIKSAYPDHAIVVRSLAPETNRSLTDELQSLGYDLVITRSVFLAERAAQTQSQRRQVRRDRALLEKLRHEFKSSGFLPDDFLQMERLHRMLNIDKHSNLNTAFTAQYFRRAFEHGLFHFDALLDDKGILCGFVTTQTSSHIGVLMHLGYNTRQPHAHERYRMLDHLS